MGIYIIKTPDIGEGIAEVELVAWHVKVGDHVNEDQPIADVMTDKATVEVPSPKAGTVVSLGGKAGSIVAVGAELIRMQVEGEGNFREDEGLAISVTDEPEASAPISVTTRSKDSAAVASSSNPVKQETERFDTDTLIPRSGGSKPMAAPSIRRAALEMGIDLRLVAGSGSGGRILRKDLDAYTQGYKQVISSGAGKYPKNTDQEQIAVIGMRRKIAQKMQEAKRRIPHFSYVEEIDVTELEILRASLNTKFSESRGKLTLLPLLARAVVLAVKRFPQMNARFDDEGNVITRFGALHLGIATQTDSGLMVPVVRHAEAKDTWQFAAELNRLANAARSSQISRDELGGSTLTISSLGSLGGLVTTPVINYPEVAIIGVNKIAERPVVRNGSIVVRHLMNLSSSFDHRVIDGMEAAEFVQAIRQYLEAPALLFVD